jgi:hypothetical protein
LQVMTGFFGSTMIVPTLDTKPRGETRMNLRFSRTLVPARDLVPRIITGTR